MQIDVTNLTPADFTVKVKGYPRNISEQEIANHL